eukprot:scaffold207857_cov17-Tisochrysis_lutea.AAC.1
MQERDACTCTCQERGFACHAHARMHAQVRMYGIYLLRTQGMCHLPQMFARTRAVKVRNYPPPPTAPCPAAAAAAAVPITAPAPAPHHCLQPSWACTTAVAGYAHLLLRELLLPHPGTLIALSLLLCGQP